MKKTATLIPILFFLASVFTAQAQVNAKLVINEFDYDQPSTDTAEFIEIYNADTFPVDLGLYRILLFNGNGNVVYDSINFPTYSFTDSTYFVVCGNGGFVPMCNFVINASSNIVQNGGTLPDAIALYDTVNQVIVDAVSYEGDCLSPYIEGIGIATAQSDSGTNAYVGLSRFPDGWDTDVNADDFHKACITPGLPNSSDTSGCPQPTSVKKMIVNHRLVVYPNPATEKVFLFGIPSSKSKWDVGVYDITGKCALQNSYTAINNIITVDVSSLENGVYMITTYNTDHPDFLGKMKLTVTH